MTEKMTGTDVRRSVQDMFETAKQSRLIITSRSGKQVLGIPLLVAIVLAVLAPKLAILVAIIALLKRAHVNVVTPEKHKSHDSPDSDEPQAEAA